MSALDSNDPFGMAHAMPNRWENFRAAVLSLPGKDDPARNGLLETCKALCTIDPIAPNDIAEIVRRTGILYPDYRLSSQEERDSIADAFLTLFNGVDADVFELAMSWYAESPARHFCSPGHIFSLCEPVLAARAYWRIEAGRIASKLQPGLTLVQTDEQAEESDA